MISIFKCNQGEKNELAVISADSRSFDEKLEAVISEPFDQREYEALMNEAIRRKPVMKQRNLRSMSKRYRTHETGLSYLDYYPGKNFGPPITFYWDFVKWRCFQFLSVWI